MKCLHDFKPHRRLAILFCPHCGEWRELGARAPSTPREPAPRVPRSARNLQAQDVGPKQEKLPFGVPHAINADGRSMFESDTPEDDGMLELERAFFGADPETQAAMIEDFRKMRGIRREGGEPADTVKTYVPGEQPAPGSGNLDPAPPATP